MENNSNINWIGTALVTVIFVCMFIIVERQVVPGNQVVDEKHVVDDSYWEEPLDREDMVEFISEPM